MSRKHPHGIMSKNQGQWLWEKFVDYYETFQDSSSRDSKPENYIKVIDADIGRKLNFQRLAIHHITLPQQCRTSSPHAESLEEEFIYVLKGQPHVWINGYVYQLDVGHAVGFPAGTGIAHTFINNSGSEVELLVLGERTKKENLCSFPVNPELEATMEIWWHDAPTHTLGPHNGLPGVVQQNEIGSTPPKCTVFCPGKERGAPFHYPGDNETFGEGFRISDEVGLKALGVWYEILPPGRRSAFPHAHTHEEEFIYVLQGNPTVWMNGYVRELEPGMFVAFPPGTGISHVVINDTNDPVMYLGVGEAQEFPDEKIIYPMNPLRELECQRKGWHWSDVAKHEFGSHSGRPREEFPEHLAFVPCEVAKAGEVLQIFNTAPGYFEKVDGCQPTLAMATHAIEDMPPKRSETYIKDFLIIKYLGKQVGVVDLHVNHPEQGICYLGLLLISDDFSGRGLGRRCHALIEDYVKRAYNCRTMRLGVSSDNDVSGFWSKLGYVANGKTYEWKGEKKTTMVREFDKEIANG